MPAAPSVDHFERARRRYETRNEIIIALVRTVATGLALVGHTSNNLFGLAGFTSPPLLIVFVGASSVLCAALLLYLLADPPYRWWRAYAFTIFDFAVYAASAYQVGRVLPPQYVGFVPVPLFLTLLVLTGLRLQRGCVLLAGVLMVMTHLVLFAPYLPQTYIVPIVAVLLASTAVCTLAVSYLVGSVLSLNRDAVLKERLARFLEPELVEVVSRDPAVLEGVSETRTATVLFADLRGFTALSERIAPAEVVALLNRFLEEMTQAITTHGGMLDKYIGDAVMAVFGVPLPRDDHADAALAAALEIRRRVEHLNATLPPSQQMGVGVGIHTGEVVVGPIGSTQRLDYTAIGDAVNVASRLESLCAEWGESLLLSDPTRTALQRDAPLRAVGEATLRHRAEPLRLWTPLSP